MDTSASYEDTELRAALDTLLRNSSDPQNDARHIFGFGDPGHELSRLQQITATIILDYQQYLDLPGTPSLQEQEEMARQFVTQYGPVLALQQAIKSQAPRMALAAEFKRASPSKGDLAADDLDAGQQAVLYAAAGADIVSVLTEKRYGSKPAEAAAVARRYRPAILRKDFVVSQYMIAEAAASGADTVLLMVAVLPQHLLTQLIIYARSLGLEPLVEVHADSELDVALAAGAKVIGVNNRNLHTFQLDLSTSERVAQELKQRNLAFEHNDQEAQYILCALSGMSSALDVDRYRRVGLGMCLIGESLMRSPDPAAAIAGLCLHPDDFDPELTGTKATGAYIGGTQLIKVCGITNADDALVACQAGANLVGVIFAEKSKRKVTAEQAKQVVDAVRGFGERSQPIQLSAASPNKMAPKAHFVAGSRLLVEACKRPAVVGVFQDQSPEYIRQMVQECGLDVVQLHGSEGMAAADQDLYGVPVIRVVDIEVDPVTGVSSPNAVKAILESISDDPIAILLDTVLQGNKQGGGGTGTTFDWTIAQHLQDSGLPVLIAGGLTAESVSDCVGTIRPFGVDVSSGVELSPGVKDHNAVRAFVRNARKAAIQANKGF